MGTPKELRVLILMTILMGAKSAQTPRLRPSSLNTNERTYKSPNVPLPSVFLYLSAFFAAKPAII